MLETIVESGCDIIMRVPNSSKEDWFRFLLNRIEEENIVCIFSTKRMCRTFYANCGNERNSILYLKNRNVKLKGKSTILICTPERLDSSLRFSSSYTWLTDFDCIMFYDLDLLLNESRANKLEADIIRTSRLNPYLRKIAFSTRIKNIDHLSVWTKSCVTDYTGSGEAEYVSRFFDEENVLTQSLIEIVSSSSRTKKELESFFKSSFAYFQGNAIPTLSDILSRLLDHGLIMKEKNYYPTSLGKLCAGLYLPLTYQCKIISMLKNGKSPSTVKRALEKDGINHHWAYHTIDVVSRLIGV